MLKVDGDRNRIDAVMKPLELVGFSRIASPSVTLRLP